MKKLSVKSISGKSKKTFFIRSVFLLAELLFFVLGIVSIFSRNGYRLLGCLFWGAVLAYLYFSRNSSPLQKAPLITGRRNVAAWIVCAVVVFLCVVPMSASPAYNGEFPQHRNQYEVLARSLKNGHIYLDYDDVDPKLEELENPYDPEVRAAAEVNYHSDHAYYKGHYYMYFGIVPSLILFLPYLLLTGQDLTTYHATQIFVALSIIGIFLLFRRLAKKFFPSMPEFLILSLSTAFSVINIYFSIDTPALYCTAIVSAVCLEIWSLYFFFHAIYLIPQNREWKQVLFAVIGGILGAAAFGCRPPAALGNFLLIPFFVEFLRKELKRKQHRFLIIKIFLAALPYLIIGGLLMYYNYIRFENPFEFGQAYQLTAMDQSSYVNFLERFSTVRSVNGLLTNFIGFTPITGDFPYVYFNSVFVNFPILLFVFLLFSEKVRFQAKQKNLLPLMITLFFLPVLITLAQIQWAPGDGSAERYRMDLYYLITLLCFLVIGFWQENLSAEKKTKFSAGVCFLCFAAIFACLLFSIAPSDWNYTDWYPEALENWRKVLMLR